MLQAWDFVPGSNFVVEMDRAAKEAKRTIAVLSPSFLGASFTQPEWGSAFADDPTGAERKLVPVRVANCDPRGLLGQVVHLDLVGLDEAQARDRLLAGVRARLKPSAAPAFPGGVHADETPPAFPGDDEAPKQLVPTPVDAGQTWVKINDLILSVDEVDDAGDTITLKGRLDDDALRRLEALRDRRSGQTLVRFVSASRVVDATLDQLRRTTRGTATETTIELTRAVAARSDAMRAGTGGMSADDLVEAGLRHLFFGEPLPSSLGLLASMADPGLDSAALALAFALEDTIAREVVRLLVVEGLVGRGNAQAVTRVEIGTREREGRAVVIEWLEPHMYVNVEPQRRRIEGTWRPD